jgi:serine/threonine protein kinase
MLKKSDNSFFKADSAITLIYNILCSIAFLHEANVLHRDIKPANLLVDKNLDVKITDFGYSRSAPSPITHSRFTTTSMRE